MKLKQIRRTMTTLGWGWPDEEREQIEHAFLIETPTVRLWYRLMQLKISGLVNSTSALSHRSLTTSGGLPVLSCFTPAPLQRTRKPIHSRHEALRALKVTAILSMPIPTISVTLRCPTLP